MELSQIKNKSIELFVENEIDIYKGSTDIDFSDMLEIYIKSDGFIVFVDKENKFIGYLEKSDAVVLQDLFIDKKNLHETTQELIKNKKITLRENCFVYKQSLIDVLKILDVSSQIYFPVTKNNYLMGRVSKEKLRNRIAELY